MPVYLYKTVPDDGSQCEYFEMEHSMKEDSMTVHPETGTKIVKVMVPPNIGIKHTAGAVEKKLDNKNVEKAGFTKYVRDKLTGDYHKVAGKNKNLPSKLNTTAYKKRLGL